MKRIFALSIAALALTACGSTGGSSSSIPSSSTSKGDGSGSSSLDSGSSSSSSFADPIKDHWWSTEGNMTYAADGKATFEDVDIDLATVVTGDDITPFRDLVSEFNSEYQGKIRVNVESISQDTFEKDVGQRIATNSNAPDLVMCHNKSHKNMVENKLIQPLDEGYNAAKIDLDIKQYVDGLAALSNLGYEGYEFSLPIDAQSLVIYYNKGILEALGKSLPTNHQELLDVCKAYSQSYDAENDYYPVSCGVADNKYFQKYLFLTMYIQNGGELYNKETLKAEWTSDKNIQAFKDTDKAIKDLTTNQYFKYGENLQTSETRFFNNKSLFLIDRPWAAKNTIFKGYQTINTSVEDINAVIGGTTTAGLFAMDSTKPTAQYIFGESHAFVMSKTVKDINVKAAIATFANWFTTNGTIGASWGEAGHMSASKTILDSDEYNGNAFVNTFLNGWYSSPNDFQTLGNTIHYSELLDRLYDVATQCLSSPENIEVIVAIKEEAFNDYVDLAGM